MSDDKEDLNGLTKPDKVVDMGELGPVDKKDIPDFDLTDEEEVLLKKKLEKLRKQDPFIYR